MVNSIVLAELIDRNVEKICVFKLSDLGNQYSKRLSQFGVNRSSLVHVTCLKNRLLSHLPALQAHKKGKDVFLSFNENIANIFVQDNDSDALSCSGCQHC